MKKTSILCCFTLALASASLMSSYASTNRSIVGTWEASHLTEADVGVKPIEIRLSFTGDGTYMQTFRYLDAGTEEVIEEKYLRYTLDDKTLILSNGRTTDTNIFIWGDSSDRATLITSEPKIRIELERKASHPQNSLVGHLDPAQAGAATHDLLPYFEGERGMTLQETKTRYSNSISPLEKNDRASRVYRAFSINDVNLNKIECNAYLIFSRLSDQYCRLYVLPSKHSRTKFTGVEMFQRFCTVFSAVHGQSTELRHRKSENWQDMRRLWRLPGGDLSVEVKGQQAASGWVKITFEPVDK